MSTNPWRIVVLSVCLVFGALIIAQASTSHPVPLPVPLASLPLQMAGWSGSRAPDLDAKIINQLQVDDYLNRLYRDDASRTPVGLYVGYYDSQSQGETMHSPLNCLPGSGWQPIQGGHLTIPLNAGDLGPLGQPLAAASSLEINRFLVQKGGEYLLVLYWYQSHGRVVASEYWGKIFTVVDGLRLRRTDAALVRVVIPVLNPTTARDPHAEERAEALGVNFVHAVFPLIVRHLPL